MLKSLFKKTVPESSPDDITGVLDPKESAVIVTRGKACEIVFIKNTAEIQMPFDTGKTSACNDTFADFFPGICDYCPYGSKNKDLKIKSFDIEDTNGSPYAVRISNIGNLGGKPAVIFIIRDNTPAKAASERLYALAYTDQLTGVPNRLKLKEDFNEIEERIARNEASGAVALFDLDQFKAINDNYGHNTGDAILRRLTEYLQSKVFFADHIYRLGGDEFVLLYVDPADRFSAEEEMEQHYNKIISSALSSYTLPHIELNCTLSIGVSFFPKHGDNLSDILRKADIALYKAKSAGRNQVVLFEEQYDTGQKFKDVYVSIQPILLKSGETHGYELTDSEPTDNMIEEDIDTHTVNLNMFNRALDALGLNDIENNLHYFINYSRQLLNPAVTHNLPKEKFIVQIQLPPNMSDIDLRNELQTYEELRSNGYRLALLGLESSRPVPELLKLVDYCKFSPDDTDPARQKSLINTYRDVSFIACGVDTHDDFKAAEGSGFQMFQGFYFNQPAVGKKTKDISPLKVNYFRLLKLYSTGDYMDFREISSIIESDVALSYKLLKILNSAAVGLKNVTSIESALAYIGEENLKKWMAVLALRGVAEDKPLELVRMLLIRSRFGELLAPNLFIKRDPKQVFLVSMLSMLHIALDMSKEDLAGEINVSEEIRESLLTKRGMYSDILRFYEDYESSNWEAVAKFVQTNHLDPSSVNEAYIASLKWYYDLTEE